MVRVRCTAPSEPATIQLVYFQGCPHVGEARRRLATVLRSAGMPLRWREWNTRDSRTPESLRRLASPSILINGKSVTGDDPWSPHPACRLDGAPSALLIRTALRISLATADLDRIP